MGASNMNSLAMYYVKMLIKDAQPRYKEVQGSIREKGGK